MTEVKALPKDVLFIGDSMIKRVQVYCHPQRVWKFCYPGATAESLHKHVMTEDLPGEAHIGCVVINAGTNDLSRSRGRYRGADEVFETIKFLILRMGALYPQAKIVFVGILPRLDWDNDRVLQMNTRVKEFTNSLKPRYDVFNFAGSFQKTVYPGRRKVVITDYYRNLKEDTVHLSDAGTQVQQDVFNRFFVSIDQTLDNEKIDGSLLMWQSEWERFNYWNLKTPLVRKSAYMEGKKLTNFTPKQYDEIVDDENRQKNREVAGPLNREEAMQPARRYHY